MELFWNFTREKTCAMIILAKVERETEPRTREEPQRSHQTPAAFLCLQLSALFSYRNAGSGKADQPRTPGIQFFYPFLWMPNT